MSSDTPSSPDDWRGDPGWRPIQYDSALYSDISLVPAQPTPEAELAQPPVWASLYDGRRIVVTWWRPFTSPPPSRATVVADE